MKEALISLCAGLALALPAVAQAETDFKVTLLGTGSPNPNAQRFGPSTLVQAGSQTLLIDAGRGASIRMWQAGVPLSRPNALLLTHFHSDHTSGIADIWLTGWVDTPYGRRTSPFQVIGPVGTKRLMQGLEQAYADDIKIRLKDEKNPVEGAKVAVKEFKSEGVVYQQDGVVVTAFEVDHGDAIKPSFGYRIDYKGHAVVISGDTRYTENVVKYGRNVDLLIHEVAIVNPDALKANDGFKRIFDHHTSPQEAGSIFKHARPRMAAYTHLVFLPDPRFPVPTVDDVMHQTRETYDGPLQVGADLMSFSIGETVEVKPFSPKQ
ncbi:MBL fold metallo-hydrolase [Massilia sp. LXY-6]|uniref:MBL fold metallo-hydrolase n=1 Tax=Massilia sp. LXY-6 TaxID=3379823 RepID=UPI003EE1059B